MSAAAAILAHSAHRPLPLPRAPWLLFQRWQDVLLCHWPLPPDALAQRLPAGVEPDLHQGSAWVSLVAMRVHESRLRWAPPLPGASGYVGANVRTYVRRADAPGVLFLSLDASSRAAVVSARLRYRLPFFRSRAMHERRSDRVHYRSLRVQRQAPPAELAAWCRPGASAAVAAPGSLDHWLTERYRLYAARGAGLSCADIHHAAWPLAAVEVELATNTLLAAAGLEPAGPPARAQFCRGIDVLLWAPRRA
jgi:uncharacterized protein YqjF (DUF2071 family)